MKIIRKDLLKILERAGTVVPKTTPLPVLSHVLLSAEDDNITLTATDLYISYIGMVPVKREGLPTTQFTLAGNRFHKIIKELPQEEFEMLYKDNTVHIKAGKSSFKLSAGLAEDYPAIETDNNQTYLATCNLSEIKSLVSKTAFAAGDDRGRLNMIRLVFKDNMVRCTAADGYRIADCSIAINDLSDGIETILLPSNSAAIIKALTGDPDTELTIYKQGNRIMFVLPDEKIIINQLEYEFPNTDDIISRVGIDKEATLPTTDVLKALNRTALMSDETMMVKLVFQPNMLSIYSESQDGNASDQIEIDYAGDEYTVCFNATYLIEFLRASSNDHVRFCMPLLASDPHMLTTENNKYVYVVMPVAVE